MLVVNGKTEREINFNNLESDFNRYPAPSYLNEEIGFT